MAGSLTPEAVLAAVERIMCRPWQWGPADCCSAACDVYSALHGVDPMASVRGYVGKRGAARLIRARGGFVALASDLARNARLVPGEAVGGIGVSREGAAEGGSRRALMICIQPGLWAGKTTNGFALVRGIDRAWHAQISSDDHGAGGLCRTRRTGAG